MGRRVGYVLVFLGLFLIFFGLVERVYAYPRLKKAPLDQYSQPVATGTGTYFNRSPDKLQEVNGAELRNIRTVRGDVKAGSDEVAVWDSFNSTVAVADGCVAMPSCVAVAPVCRWLPMCGCRLAPALSCWAPCWA